MDVCVFHLWVDGGCPRTTVLSTEELR
jgi:hypothetical protein